MCTPHVDFHMNQKMILIVRSKIHKIKRYAQILLFEHCDFVSNVQKTKHLQVMKYLLFLIPASASPTKHILSFSTTKTTFRKMATRTSTSSTTTFSSLHSSSTSIIDSTFQDLITGKKKYMLLDGGTGEELFKHGVPDDREIWSATAVVNSKHHNSLRQVHRSFLDAGSEVITTNSYGIVPGVGFSPENIKKYGSIAGKIAFQCCCRTCYNPTLDTQNSRNNNCDEKIERRDNEKRRPLVFGSLGPLVESYRPDLIKRHDEGVECYSNMIEALYPHVDAFVAETMSSVEESIQAFESLSLYNNRVSSNTGEKKRNTKNILISYTLNSDGFIRSGEDVVQGIKRLLTISDNKESPKILAILFNCSEPEAITKALRQIHSTSSCSSSLSLTESLSKRNIVLGAYPNRLTPVPENWSLSEYAEEPQAERDDLSPQQYYEDFVKLWVNEYQVKIIGGCCGITPEHIQYIKQNFPSS